MSVHEIRSTCRSDCEHLCTLSMHFSMTMYIASSLDTYLVIVSHRHSICRTLTYLLALGNTLDKLQIAQNSTIISPSIKTIHTRSNFIIAKKFFTCLFFLLLPLLYCWLVRFLFLVGTNTNWILLSTEKNTIKVGGVCGREQNSLCRLAYLQHKKHARERARVSIILQTQALYVG